MRIQWIVTKISSSQGRPIMSSRFVKTQCLSVNAGKLIARGQAMAGIQLSVPKVDQASEARNEMVYLILAESDQPFVCKFQKLEDQSTARKIREFHGAWPKFDQVWSGPVWVGPSNLSLIRSAAYLQMGGNFANNQRPGNGRNQQSVNKG